MLFLEAYFLFLRKMKFYIFHRVVKVGGGYHFACHRIGTSVKSLRPPHLLATIGLLYADRQLCRYFLVHQYIKFHILVFRVIRSTAAHLFDESVRTSVCKIVDDATTT